HSMGGSAALLYAGTEPERVSALVLVEGLGPPAADPAQTAERWGAWVGELETIARPREPGSSRKPLTLASATRRLAERFPLWSPEVVRHMALHGTRVTGDVGDDRDGGGAGADPAGGVASIGDGDHRVDQDAPREWRFEPLHQTRSPQPYYVAQARSFWRRVACPVLYVEGTRSYISAAPIEVDARVREIGAERATIEGAGHHPQLERAEETGEVIAGFLGRVPRAERSA
ncbi:MAG: alpha/beta hydrolase, partial [Alphaproteobacteria bacterium]